MFGFITRFFLWLSSWFSHIYGTITQLYRDELEKQSRGQEEYERLLKYKKIQQDRMNTPVSGLDEENILGTISKPAQSSHIPVQSEIKPSPVTPVKQTSQPIVNTPSSAKKEELMKPEVKTPVHIPPIPINTVQQSPSSVSSIPITPITTSVEKKTATVTPSNQVVNKSIPSNQTSVQKEATKPRQPVTSQQEIEGIIGERLKNLKRSKTEPVSTMSTKEEDLVAKTNSQILQRKLSSKPKKSSRRPAQRDGKAIASKLDILESAVDVPTEDKFKELEEFSQLEKKMGLENAQKEIMERRKQEKSKPNVSSPAKSNTTAPGGVSLDAILTARSVLRKTGENLK